MTNKQQLPKRIGKNNEQPGRSKVSTNDHEPDEGQGGGASGGMSPDYEHGTCGENDDQKHPRRDRGAGKTGAERLPEKLRIHRATGSEKFALPKSSCEGKMEIPTSRIHGLASSLLITTAGFVAAWHLPLQAFALFGGLYTAALGIAMGLAMSTNYWLLGFMRAFCREVGPNRMSLIFVVAVFPLFGEVAATQVLAVFGLSVATAAVFCGLNDAVLVLDLGLKERKNS